MKLTGETRYRAQKRLFQKPVLVLQVEVFERVVVNRWGDTETCKTWRDASVEDLTMIRKLGCSD